jgi:hypothetical protein
MNEKELQLVTLEQAKRLKEIGFDWVSYHSYGRYSQCNYGEGLPVLEEAYCDTSRVGAYCELSDLKTCGILAPTVALALKWFRDVKMIRNAVCCLFYNTSIEMWYGDFKFKGHYNATSKCSTYEEAESALLDKLLKLEI